MTVGDVINKSPLAMPPLATENLLGPRNAMAETLVAYLERATFTVWGGGKVKNTTFQLTSVKKEWPDPREQLCYPTASLIQSTQLSYLAASFSPYPMEETWGKFDRLVCANPSEEVPQTVLWREGEGMVEFQLDFFCDGAVQREAVEAKLGSLFNPSSERAGVMLVGPDRYYSRCVRATLLSTRSVDTAVTTHERERRLRCRIRAEIDIVSLRQGVAFEPRFDSDVTEPAVTSDSGQCIT